MSYKNSVEMRVLVNGRPAREYSRDGTQYIESRKGTQYTIKIKNDNSFRVMAVVSVDGLDVITGKAAEDSNQGYLINAYSSTEIKGYRLTDDTSAAFVFTSKDGSYVANATGDARNSGVIGVRVFAEKEHPKPKVVEKHIHHHHWDYEPYHPWIDPYVYPKYPWKPYPYSPPVWYSCSNSTSGLTGLSAGNLSTNVSYNCSIDSQRGDGAIKSLCTSPNISTQVVDHSVNCVAAASVVNDFDTPIKYDSFDMGTTWGEKQNDRVQKEVFHRGKVISEIVVYYASADALKNMGIDLTDTPRISEAPKAFGDSQYCRPPTGWRG